MNGKGNFSVAADRRRPTVGPYTKLAFAIWVVICAVLAARLMHLSHRVTTFGTYREAGARWRDGQPVYTSDRGMGFVYSPLVAAYFAIYTFIPERVGELVWLVTNVGLLVGGTYAVMRESVFRIAKDRGRALVLVLLAPLSLASLDVAQANAALIGLLLLATAMAMRGRWTLCAIAICLATYLKIYPVALGLVLCVYRPGKMAWRLGAGLAGLGILSMALQNPHYVVTQYHAWISTRGADDRQAYSMTHAPLDLWYLLVRLGHLPMSEGCYRALQVMSGGGVAVFSYFTTRWTAERRLAGIWLLCTCWMILLGPATESYTYALLAPVLSLGVVAAFSREAGAVARGLVVLSMGLFLAAQLKSSFYSGWRSATFNGMRPVAALVLLAFVILWLRDDGMWDADAPSAAA